MHLVFSNASSENVRKNWAGYSAARFECHGSDREAHRRVESARMRPSAPDAASLRAQWPYLAIAKRPRVGSKCLLKTAGEFAAQLAACNAWESMHWKASEQGRALALTSLVWHCVCWLAASAQVQRPPESGCQAQLTVIAKSRQGPHLILKHSKEAPLRCGRSTSPPMQRR